MASSIGPIQRRLSREEIAALYVRTGALVLRRCRFLLRDEAEAEDVLQEVFVRVMRYGGPASEEGRIELAFLYRTAERCCFDRMKKRSREPLQDPDSAVEIAVHTAERSEAAQLVLRFFERLSPKLQQVALLHHLDGLPQERIAEELSWSRRTIGKKLKQIDQQAQRLAVQWKERKK